MHFDLVQSLSIASEPGKPSDDRVGVGHALGWVIDGATDLGDPGLVGSRGGAAWIAAEADRAFAAAEGGTIEAVCRQVFTQVAAAFADQRTRDPEGWEIPSAAFLAVHVAETVLDCAWLGDCAAFLIRDGQVHRIGPQFDIRDDEADLARSVAHHGLGSPNRSAPVLETLRKARTNPDRLVLGVDPTAADRVFYASQPCVAGDDIVLMTDGFSALTDSYRLVDPAALPELLAVGGLPDLAARIRAAEAEDADCTRWPRFKRGDDATALWLRVAA